jgi:hypothetical protein
MKHLTKIKDFDLFSKGRHLEGAASPSFLSKS